MSDVINAVKRLERAGSENSRATKKLHDAASEVAYLIKHQVPVGADLPRGYNVVEVNSNVGICRFLLLPNGCDEYGEPQSLWIDGTGNYLHGDFRCEIPDQTREGSLQFAKDIADGLLNEIAAWLESRVNEADSAAETLEQSK